MSELTKKNPLKIILAVILSLICCVLSAAFLLTMVLGTGETKKTAPAAYGDVQIMDSYDSFLSGALSDAAEGAYSVEKVFWIGDDVTVCPEPDQNRYGETTDPSTLQWLLDEASELLDGQDTLFRTDIEIMPGSKVVYYLDQTIFAVTWKQVISNFVYTISEVKVAHPSQFRRYLANDEYDSATYYTTTEMSAMVNAVVASSGDFYKNRPYGIVVYDGEVKRAEFTGVVDTCFIDENGDLIFSRRGELAGVEDAQKFVDENHIRFSVSFGPVLIENGERCEPDSYGLGEVNQEYSRAALGQRGELHYVVVTANGEKWHRDYTTIHTFAKNLAAFGCEKFYALDGGQTGVIATNDVAINRMDFGYQRRISDIFYFASALPAIE